MKRARSLLTVLTALGLTLSVGSLSAAPHALFWSRGQTWVVDAGEGTLYHAPKLYATGPGGVVFEYALKSHSAPSGARSGELEAQDDQQARPYGELYRWVSLERFMVGDTGAEPSVAQRAEEARVSTTLTSHYAPEQVKGDFNDDHQLLQFTGERVTLSRVVSQRLNDQRRVSRSLYTIDLANRQTLPALTEAPEIDALTRSLFPRLLPSCLAPTRTLTQWQLSGQRLTSWLFMLPTQGEQQNKPITPSAPCPPSGALRLRAPTQEGLSAGALSWEPITGQLNDLKEPLIGGVVDALLHPSGDIALLLEGESRAGEEGLFVPHPLALDEPGLSRPLSLWRRHGSPRLISLPARLELQRLDGARWLPENHPILQLLSTHFTSVAEGTPCTQQLKSHRVSAYHRPPPPPLSAHLCRVQPQGRLWGGVEDLSAQLIAAQDERTLYVDLWVRDPERATGDSVRLWLGEAEPPLELKVTPREVMGAGNLADQVLAKWVEGPAPKPTRSALGAPLITEREVSSEAPEGGYLVSLELPLSLVKGKLSVAVQDVDPATPGAKVTLWVAGEPSRPYEPPTPAPIEVK